jgi:hypothetical protein
MNWPRLDSSASESGMRVNNWYVASDKNGNWWNFAFMVQYLLLSRTIGCVLTSLLTIVGHAIVHAVSHRLPTAPTSVRSQVKSCGTCGGQSGTGAGFFWVLLFLLPILILTAPHSLSIIRCRYNRLSRSRRAKWTQPFLPTEQKVPRLHG